MKRSKILALFITLALLVATFACGLVIFADDTVAPGSKGEISVYLIAGQSNAVGYATDLPSDAAADARYTEGFDNVLYFGHHEGKMMNDFTETKVKLVDKTEDSSGAELGLASVLGNMDGNSAIIKCAYGSTKLYPERYNGSGDLKKTWTPPSYLEAKGKEADDQIGIMYTYFKQTVTAGIEKLVEDGYTPVIKGMLWMQGESETNDAKDADGNAQTTAATMSAEYYNFLTVLLSDIKADVGKIVDQDLSDMPFGMSLVSPNPTSVTGKSEEKMGYVKTINDAMKKLAAEGTNCFTIDPYKADNFYQPDTWHYNADTQQYVGEQFVAGAFGKNLVAFDGANAKMNTTLAEEGESVTVKITAARGYEVYSITKTVGGETVNVPVAKNGLYTIDSMPASEVRFNVTTVKRGLTDVETEYGTVPTLYADAEAYPWVVFNKGKEFVGAALQFTTVASGLARDAGDGAVILLRRDIDFADTAEAAPKNTTFSQVDGSITVDLGGYTVIQGATGSADAFIRLEATKAGYSTTVTLKNGNIKNSMDPIARFSAIGTRVPSEYIKTDESTGTTTYNNADETTIHKLAIVLEDLNISYESERGTFALVATGASTPKESLYSAANTLTVKNVNIDYGTSIAKNSSGNNTTGSVLSSGTYFPLNVDLYGGSIKAAEMEGDYFSTINAGKITCYPGDDGKYTTLILSADYYASLEDKVEYNDEQTSFDAEGNAMGFAFLSKNENTVEYVLSAEDVIATKYGNIPAAYASTSTYPWVVFTSEGKFRGAGKKFTTEVAAYATGYDSKTKVANDPIQNSVILLRTDTSFDGTSQGKGAQQLTCVDNANILIDLGGHTLTTADYDSADCFIRCEAYQTGYTTNITVKNGKILNGNNAIVRFCALGTTARNSNGHNATAASTAGEDNYATESVTDPHEFNVLIDGIEIVLDGNYTADYALVGAATSGISGQGSNNNVTFKDCSIDLSQRSGTLKYMSNAPTAYPVTVYVLGGSIKSLNTAGLTHTNFFGGSGTKKFGPGSDGKYTTYTTLYTVDSETSEETIVSPIPTKTYTDTETSNSVKLLEYSKDETNSTYTYIMSSLVTDYGTITSTYASILDYPIVVFAADGTFKTGTKSFTEIAAKKACEAGDGAVILFRRDMVFDTQPYGNNYLSTVNGTIYVDLGGHTMDMVESGKDAFIRLEPAFAGYSTHVKVYNGKIIAGADPIVRFAAVDGRVPTSYVDANDETQTFDYWSNTDPKLIHNLKVTLDGLDISLGSTASKYMVLYTTGSKNLSKSAANNNLIVNNCNFEVGSNSYSPVPKLFASNVTVPVNVELVGSTLNYESQSDLIWESMHSTTGSVNFKKNEDGKYFTFTLPDSETISTNKTVVAPDGTTYTYTTYKVSSENGYSTYTFRPEELSDITVKTNATLYSNFVFNVHVKALDSIESITLAGKTYTGDELAAMKVGDNYVIPVSVAAMDAAEDIILEVTAAYAEKYTGNWDLGLVKYADKVIYGSATEKSKTVVEAMLSYIKAAYTYFNTQGNVSDEELEAAKTAIDSILGADYDDLNTPAFGETAENNTPTLTGATVNLGSVIKFIFITDGTYAADLYKFKAGGYDLETTVSGNVIEVTTYAYALRDTLTYTVEGTDVSGSYNIKSYYDYMAGEGNGSLELINLLKRMWFYSESALGYRNEVIANS